ncbi:MAG: PAS domain S-box protein, partial [Chloroflexales bacterium]
MDSHSHTSDDPFALPAADGPSAQAPPTSATHERTLHELYAHTPILIGVAAIHTDDLTLVTLNPTFAHLFGATPADLQGRPLRDLAIGPDNVENLLAHAWQAWDTGAPAQAAIAWQSPLGLRRIHLTIAPILALGMPPRCSIMGVDITAHPPAHAHGVSQRDLAYRLAAATSLGEALPICLDAALHAQMDCGGIYLIDPASGNLKLAYARGLSPACVAATRDIAADSDRTRMVMAGQPRYLEYDHIVHRDQAEAHAGIRAVAVLPLSYQGRVIGCLNLGSHRAAAAHVSPASREALEVIAAQAGHVIVRLQAEAALRDSESRLRTILQTALDGFLILDRQMRIIEVNDAYCAMSGYGRADLLGMAITDINVVNPPNQARDGARIGKVLAAGVGRFETQHRRKDGSAFAIEASVHHIDSGDDEQLICFVRDITERRQREHEIRALNSDLERRVAARTAELSRVNAELARAARAKDEFFATMSHELRTPISAILMLSEALREQVRGPLNVEQIQSLATIESSGRHLLTLINDILDLAKAAAEKLDLEVELVPVDAVCQASLLFVREMAAKKAIGLSCQLDDDHAELRADERRLKQMLVNLLSNAVKFT